MDQLTLKEACNLLGVSRPTLNAYRKKYHLYETRLAGKIRLSKAEIINKIILINSTNPPTNSILTILSSSSLKQIQPIAGVYDLRKISSIDAFGVLGLLCSIKAHLKKSDNNSITLLVDSSPICSHLEAIGFFTEVERAHYSRVSFNSSALKIRSFSGSTVILPLHLIGYRGAEKKILDELYEPLLKQGFSEDYCGHIGWIIGELCDNAHTHSEGPCYLIIEALESDSTATRHLTIAIGDTGIGIPASLKKNSKYSKMQNKILLATAFKSEVSRMEVEPKRGKGLNDVVSISKGNNSWMKVESGNHAMVFDFRQEQDKIYFTDSLTQDQGTRFGIILIDSTFKKTTHETINTVMQRFLETL